MKRYAHDKDEVVDGRQYVERPIYLQNLPIAQDPTIITGDELDELQQNIEAMDQNEYFKFILESTIEGIFDQDFETSYASDLMSATVRVEGERLPYNIKLINVNDERFKIRVSQRGLIPYDSNFIYHDSLILGILEYVDYIRDQIF